MMHFKPCKLSKALIPADTKKSSGSSIAFYFPTVLVLVHGGWQVRGQLSH
jgi:hypothetical protein